MNLALETNPRFEFFRSQIGNSLSQGPSPVGRWLGGTLMDVQPHSMTVEFVVRQELTNPVGMLHGGAVSAMMDDTVGMLVFSLGREFAYTSINLNCDFLNGGRIGDVLTVFAQVIRAGKNVVHCECRVTNQDQKLIAKCATNMIQTGVRLPS